MRAYYDKKPASIEAVGNGSYYYRYGIESVTEDNHTHWVCEEVTVWAPLTREKIVKAVISEKWDADLEQKLINNYNLAKEGLFYEEKADECITAYRDFLSEREQLKNTINADWEAYNEEIL